MPPNHFESEVESFLEGSHGDRTHNKQQADHHTVTPLCGTLLQLLPTLVSSLACCVGSSAGSAIRISVELRPLHTIHCRNAFDLGKLLHQGILGVGALESQNNAHSRTVFGLDGFR